MRAEQGSSGGVEMTLLFPSEMLKSVLKNEDRDAQPGHNALDFVAAIIVVHDRLRKWARRLIHDPVDPRLLSFQANLDYRLAATARRNDRDALAFVGAQSGIQLVKERLFKVAGHVRSIAFSTAVCLPLIACQTPAVHDRVVPISVPIAVQPIKPSDVPVLPAPLPKRPADARQALDLALAQVCAFVAYGLKADPLLRVSAGLPPLEPPKYPECEH
jgi:hypothetical protein